MRPKKQQGRRPRTFNRSAAFRPKPKCPLLSAGITEVDYKDVHFLRRYVNEEWKIYPGRMNHLSAKMQRRIKTAIKRARYLSLMPYTGSHYIRRDEPSS
jgi:small subunit ribosomal protein S18